MNIVVSKQKGMSVTGWIFVIAIGLFFVLLGIKMVPNYIEYNSVSNILESLKDDSSMANAQPREIRQTISKRFNINSIYDFDPDNITIKKSKEGLKVTAEYEVREEVAGNVAVVMSFFKEVDLKR